MQTAERTSKCNLRGHSFIHFTNSLFGFSDSCKCPFAGISSRRKEEKKRCLILSLYRLQRRQSFACYAYNCYYYIKYNDSKMFQRICVSKCEKKQRPRKGKIVYLSVLFMALTSTFSVLAQGSFSLAHTTHTINAHSEYI